MCNAEMQPRLVEVEADVKVEIQVEIDISRLQINEIKYVSPYTCICRYFN